MKKLSEDEAASIPSKPAGKNSRARTILSAMKVGEIILLEPWEWTQKSNPPREMIRKLRLAEHKDFTCDTALDGSGWIIKRIK